MPRKVHPIPSLTALTCLVLAAPAGAQVTSDGTLGTTVTPSGATTYTITGGQLQGSTTLLQSFGDFSLPNTTDTAHFDLGNASYGGAANGVNTVIGRVTGGNLSTINGQIRLTGGNAPDLFLINPSGFVFGAGASLNVPGSFVASTAENVLFANNVAFGIGNTPSPLLTITAPTGLQLGNNPTAITVQGSGYALTAINGVAPLIQAPSTSTLGVTSGQTLALVGGELNLTGATLAAPQGRVELGSATGLVSLNSISQGYELSYSNGQVFSDIQLSQKSLLNVSGTTNSGAVQIQGRQVQFADGSLIFSSNPGNLAAGDIHIQASESIDIIGTTADGSIRSGIRNESLNAGTGSNITIVAPRLTLQQGAGINDNAFNNASGGSIQVNVTNVELSGSSVINPTGVTSLTTSVRGTGSAGDISVTGDRLVVSDGAALSTITFGSSPSGQVTIRNTETIVQGDNPAGLYSNISAITYGTGSAQTLTLDTARLQILNGGGVVTTSFVDGEAGDLNISATDSIQIRGRSQANNSTINSAVIDPGPLLRAFFGLPNSLTGDAGNVRVTTPNLILADGGTVSVTNQGTGNGGTVAITANTVHLDRQGSIQAQTASGDGGNLALRLRDGLIMRNESVISATAGGNGDGGNITINAPVIAGFENSDIIANAVQGNGGNITITTQGIFGLEFRPQLTPENDITASSQFGVNGTVEINEFSLDPDTGIVELPAGLADTSDQIAQGCATDGDSSFVATGRGGIPPSPKENLSSDLTWSDTRDLSEFLGAAPSGPAPAGSVPAQPPGLTEINAWRINANGQVELLAVNADAPASSVAYATCSNPTDLGT
jgi:filamentous hemagglutinin family protein